MSGERDLIARVGEVFRDGPAMRLAVVFGSTARGQDHAGSDVDVGIVPRDAELTLRAELELQRRLEAACGRPVHLIRLDRASTLLRWKVANDGRPVVSHPPHAWPRFVATSALEFAELAPQLRHAEERFRARLAAGPSAMTDRSIVLQKLATLRDHVDRVRRRRPAIVGTLRDDLDLQDAIALSLLVAIQEATDVAFHIVSDEGWGVPASYAESFMTLASHGVIDAGLALRLGQAVGLRNRIAHGYAGVDVDRLWAEIPDGLGTLDSFAAAIARFLGA